ncbi:MAG TPA: aminotransferase class I/II-fold pyridoxal phosphate-dependent enzyme [Clostridia bacterium]|nr:aminotransferase class I/II-fold pyridoxal phosphate-dependent enzyme [Clostridia bacterium]
MKIDTFKLEYWLNPRDPLCKYNLGASCVKALRLEELISLTGGDPADFLTELGGMSLHYGHFYGSERLLRAIAGLYENAGPEHVLTTHGGTGANNLAINAIVEPGDDVVAIVPSYQQHYAIPASLGANVKLLHLDYRDDYTLDLDRLKTLVWNKTKLIALSNPNNPTGKYFGRETLEALAAIARRAGAYVLCDEIYRGLDDAYMPSMLDVYEKAVVTSSMSKVFSMAGTRVGWIITKDETVRAIMENRRSYDTVCDGPIDELIAAIALEHHEAVLARSRGIVRKSRALLDEWLKTQPALHCSQTSHSATALVHYDYDIDAERLCEDIYEKLGVLLCHGGCFDEEKCFRLGYGFGDPGKFAEGLALLGQYFRELEAR